MNNKDKNKYISPEDAAKIIGKSIVTIWRYRRKGLLKEYKKQGSNKIVLLREQVENFDIPIETK